MLRNYIYAVQDKTADTITNTNEQYPQEYFASTRQAYDIIERLEELFRKVLVEEMIDRGGKTGIDEEALERT